MWTNGQYNRVCLFHYKHLGLFVQDIQVLILFAPNPLTSETLTRLPVLISYSESMIHKWRCGIFFYYLFSSCPSWPNFSCLPCFATVLSSCCFHFIAKYGSPHIKYEEYRTELHSRSNTVISRLFSTVVFDWSEDLWIHNHFNDPKQANKKPKKTPNFHSGTETEDWITIVKLLFSKGMRTVHRYWTVTRCKLPQS